MDSSMARAFRYFGDIRRHGGMEIILMEDVVHGRRVSG